MTGPHRNASAGILLLTILALPPVRHALEASMLGHMLVQLPLLALGGGIAIHGLVGSAGWRAAGFNAGGIAGILAATFAMACWMLPRSLDAALTIPLVEAVKFVAVPTLIGGAFAVSWPLAHVIVRGVVWAHAVAMLLVLGWLYTVSPTRLCVGYRLDQQTTLGWAFLAAAATLAVVLAVWAFVGTGRNAAQPPNSTIRRLSGCTGRALPGNSAANFRI